MDLETRFLPETGFLPVRPALLLPGGGAGVPGNQKKLKKKLEKGLTLRLSEIVQRLLQKSSDLHGGLSEGVDGVSHLM